MEPNRYENWRLCFGFVEQCFCMDRFAIRCSRSRTDSCNAYGVRCSSPLLSDIGPYHKHAGGCSRKNLDGHKVIEAHAEETNKLLSTAAEDNAMKWEFSMHTPVSFTITYHYKLADECEPNNPTVTLHLPTEVEVCQHT